MDIWDVTAGHPAALDDLESMLAEIERLRAMLKRTRPFLDCETLEQVDVLLATTSIGYKRGE